MLTQTINLLASARPDFGGRRAGSVYAGDRGGRRAPTGVGEDNCEAPLPAGQGDDAQDGQAARRAALGGVGTPEAGEDGAKEQDGEEDNAEEEAGEEGAPVLGADGGGPTSWRGARASADFKRPAAAENPVGQRTGGATEGGSWGGRRRWWRRRT
jgi:hypothetical protein